MRVGGLVTAAPGHPEDLLIDTQVDFVGSNGIRIRITPAPGYADRYYGIVVNGVLALPLVYVGNANEYIDTVRQYDVDSTTVSINIVDFGLWATPPEDLERVDWIVDLEASTANRIAFSWTAPTTFSQENGHISDAYAVTGSSLQISNISMTGMARGINCEKFSEFPNRARLYYSIQELVFDSGTGPSGISVQWWFKNSIVASGFLMVILLLSLRGWSVSLIIIQG